VRGLDDEVSEARARGDVDLVEVDLLIFLLGEQRLIRREPGLALGLASARREAHPLELARERPLA
jgi:hypothetical protein